jgi:uncharacterized RDD family membrane protein YckC
MNQENPYAPPKADVADVAGAGSGLASLGARLGGAAIDAIISWIVIMPLMFYSGFWRAAMSGQIDYGLQLAVSVGGIVVFLILNGYLLSKSGQTIGKRLVGTRIVSVSDGKILPLGRVVGLRYLPIWIIAQIPFIGNLIALINVLFIFRDDRRCVHDLIAGTKVVNA